MSSFKSIWRLLDPMVPIQLAYKLYQKSFTSIHVLDSPSFDAASTPYFLKRLSAARVYLEYGSGGSTVAAARCKKKFITIETDADYLSAVRQKIEGTVGVHDGTYIHADIGMTGRWGFPIFKYPTPSRLALWRKFPEIPWEVILKNPDPSLWPDLILIDGRFRVACALVSIKHLHGKTDFEILVDDYEDRSYYFDIEKFAKLEGLHGRMAVFKPQNNGLDLQALQQAIEFYSSDWR